MLLLLLLLQLFVPDTIEFKQEKVWLLRDACQFNSGPPSCKSARVSAISGQFACMTTTEARGSQSARVSDRDPVTTHCVGGQTNTPHTPYVVTTQYNALKITQLWSVTSQCTLVLGSGFFFVGSKMA